MPSSPASVRRQVGAMIYRRQQQNLEVLLVTSNTRKRWIIPKGNLEPDLDARESARLEAYEEAGVEGRISTDPLGSYLHDRRGHCSVVEVFLMEAERELPRIEWPESHMRERCWMPIDAARDAVMEEGLKDLFLRADKLIRSA